MTTHLAALFSAFGDSSAIVHRVGWLLLHSLWQFCLVAMLLAIVLRAMTRASSTKRYAATLVALGLMILCPGLTWLACDGRPNKVFEASAQLREPQPLDAFHMPAPHGPSETIAVAADTSRKSSQKAHLDQAVAPGILSSESIAAEIARSQRLLEPWLPALVAFWLVGVCIFAVRPVLSWSTVRKLRVRGTSSVPDTILRMFENAVAKTGLRTPVRILQSSLIKVPAVIGYFRPLVLIPFSLVAGLPPEQLEALLIHELAHIRRRDYLVNLLQTLVETLFFYHPAIWWVSTHVRCERENCCDDAALLLCCSQSEYAKALLAVEELRTRLPVTALAASDGSLLVRIRRIVGVNQEQKPGLATLLSAVVIFAGIGVGGWTAKTGGTANGGKSETAAPFRTEMKTASATEKAPFQVKLTDGAVIEFVGLFKRSADVNEWWTPDGVPLAATPTERPPAQVWNLYSKANVRGLALDTKAKRPATFSVWIPGTEMNYSAAREVIGDRVHESHRQLVTRDGRSSATVWVKYVPHGWQTIGPRGIRPGQFGLTPVEFSEGKLVFAEPTEKDGNSRAVVTYDLKDTTPRLARVVAIDKQGREHLPQTSIDSGDIHMVQGEFLKLPLAQIHEFRLQSKEIQQIEFRNVSLQPGQKTTVEIFIDGKRYVPGRVVATTDIETLSGVVNRSAKSIATGDVSETASEFQSEWKLFHEVARGFQANNDAIKTWQGQARIGDYQLSPIDGQQHSTAIVDFAFDAQQRAVRWNYRALRPGRSSKDAHAFRYIYNEIWRNNEELRYGPYWPDQMRGAWVLTIACWAEMPNVLANELHPLYLLGGGRNLGRWLNGYADMVDANFRDTKAVADVFRVKRDGNRIVIRKDGSWGYNEYVFDSSQGYALTSSAIESADIGITWNFSLERLGGAFVPKKVDYTQIDIPPNGQRRVSFSRSFFLEGQTVNGPMGDAEFSIERMGIRPGDFVHDQLRGVTYKYEPPADKNVPPAAKLQRSPVPLVVAKSTATERLAKTNDGEKGRLEPSKLHLIASNSKTPRLHTEEFENRYHLAAGEVFKHVGPPYAKGRNDLYDAATSAEAKKAVPNGPSSQFFQQEGDKLTLWSGNFDESGTALYRLLQDIARIYPVETTGTRALWLKKIRGDFVFRKGAKPEEIVNAVGQMLNDELHLDVRLESQIVEREVYVARGSFNPAPAGRPWNRNRDSRPYLVYGEVKPDTATPSEQAFGTFAEFLKAVGTRVGRPIINEAANPPRATPEDPLGWQEFFDEPQTFNGSPFPLRHVQSADLVLRHVHEQTGLKFEPETRRVRIVSLTKRKK